ncbi:MAG: hypothetical protein WAW90_01190, partial [Minisyncoccia bacterium]
MSGVEVPTLNSELDEGVVEPTEKKFADDAMVVLVAVKYEARTLFSKTPLPDTDNFAYGVVVPTPTFPPFKTVKSVVLE